MSKAYRGFTLIELMIVVAMIAILSAIAIPQYRNFVYKSEEGTTRGNLGAIRSAISIYYGDNDGVYPADDLTTLYSGYKYIRWMPSVQTPPYHSPSPGVQIEKIPTDTGQWSYDNDSSDSAWGRVLVGCTHQDIRGNVWTTY